MGDGKRMTADEITASMREAQQKGMTPQQWLEQMGVSPTGNLEQMLARLCSERGLNPMQLMNKFFGGK